MRVDLDQIEFYHGPSRPPFSTSVRSVHSNNDPAVPPNFQQSFPTGFGFRPGPCEVPPGQSSPLTGTTHEWNIFDFEINHVYGHTQPGMTKDVEPAVTGKMPATRGVLLDRGSPGLAFSEPVPSTDSERTSFCPAGPDHLDPIPPDMRGDDLSDAVLDTKERETSRLSCVPAVTAPVPAPEQANCASSNLSVVGDSQQESAKRKLSATEPSDSSHPADCENDTEPGQTSDLDENPCARASEAPERAEDTGTAKDTSATSCPSSPPTAHSTSRGSRIRTTQSPNIPVRFPSIAVVVPPPSWKQGATRTSTRAAAAVCKKRLRSGQRTNHFQDGNMRYDTEQPCSKRRKRKSPMKSSSGPSNFSVSVPSHHSGTTQGLHGNAVLTVDTKSGLKPAYYFTFVPDPSPMLCQPDTQVVSGKQRPYTSDENALLVRLKETEAMPWSEITTHFLGRSMSSLQVHYSTKLRHKATSRSGTRKRRE